MVKPQAVPPEPPQRTPICGHIVQTSSLNIAGHARINNKEGTSSIQYHTLLFWFLDIINKNVDTALSIVAYIGVSFP
jgi:hypothetical protein